MVLLEMQTTDGKAFKSRKCNASAERRAFQVFGTGKYCLLCDWQIKIQAFSLFLITGNNRKNCMNPLST